MGQIKHKMGKVGGGVDISHKSKMSGKAKNLMSFPGGMPGPGEYGNMDPRPAKIVGKGMAKYLAGESVGMRKMGEHYGPGKELVGQQGNLPEGLKAQIEAAPEPKQSRADKTKMKAKKAKMAADKANDGSSNASLDKMNKTKAKAERLAKRQKRQEGRAERKKIKKAGLSRGDKRKQIIDSRKKQKSTSKSKGMAEYKDVPMKTDPAKKKDPAKTDTETVVSGDKSKVNNKITKTDAKAKKIELEKERRAIARAKALEKIKEKRELLKVKRDLEKNKREQKRRKRDGKDYQVNTGTDNQKTIRRS